MGKDSSRELIIGDWVRYEDDPILLKIIEVHPHYCDYPSCNSTEEFDCLYINAENQFSISVRVVEESIIKTIPTTEELAAWLEITIES